MPFKIQQRKCSALTATNTNCLRRAISGSIFCRIHQGKNNDKSIKP
jgi:hypothetical protein